MIVFATKTIRQSNLNPNEFDRNIDTIIIMTIQLVLFRYTLESYSSFKHSSSATQYGHENLSMNRFRSENALYVELMHFKFGILY